jgi:hypothetical protein
MKTVLILIIIAVSISFAGRVNGYHKKKSGIYVQSYHRSHPDKSKLNNYSHKGNRNPYTGKPGTKK